MTTQQVPPAQLKYAIVKQVLSGDTVLLRTMTTKGGPPKEKTLALSSVVAPKLARRPNQNGEGGTKDDPFAWEAREFLRKKLIGQKVCFTLDTPTQNTTREYGTIYIGKEPALENVTELLVSEGLVDVRRSGVKSTEAHQRLCELEDNAKGAGKGKHGAHASEHVRKIKWTVENHRNFVESLHYEPVKAIVEHVRDGSTMRVLLLPNSSRSEFYSINLMLSGIRSPTFREDNPEPFAEEAKFYTECRLLQRDVEVILESVSNQNFLGTVIHPKGNITELLLLEGFARCVDWSLQCVTQGFEKLRLSEKSAKEKKLRLWKDYNPCVPIIDAEEKEFQGKVVEILNADAFNVKLADGSVERVFLASIRPPRLENSRDMTKKEKEKVRPLYDIPYMFEAREFLRKKLIGKKVNVIVDYLYPCLLYPAKKCSTVTIGGINVAEALVSKGLATVVRYRADDDQRSSHYDELLSAETKAIKSAKGLHSKKDPPLHRVVDLAGDLQKSKQFFPFLQRAGRMEAVVEFVTSGSRLKVFVPRENCLIILLLGGITCLRCSREQKAGQKHGMRVQGEPYGDDALAYTKDLCLQKEVQIEVESMDKAGNFIGWLWIDNINLSEALVKEGFADVHSTAARSPYCRQLQVAQEEAQKKKLRMWENQVPVEIEPRKVEDTSERSVNYIEVMVTDVRLDLTFYAQHVDEGTKLEEFMKEMRESFAQIENKIRPYTPKKNEVCGARFKDDGLWYRAKCDKVQGDQISITYVDFGNQEITTAVNIAPLSAKFQAFLPHCAHEYALAFIKAPQDTEAALDARSEFFDIVNDRRLLLNVEYKTGSLPCVTLLSSDKKEDIGKELVAKGFVFVDQKRDRKFQKIISEYITAQDGAKKERLNLWQYGDVTEDDAKEFG